MAITLTLMILFTGIGFLRQASPKPGSTAG